MIDAEDMGWALHPGDGRGGGDDADALMGAADRRLYAHKHRRAAGVVTVSA